MQKITSALLGALVLTVTGVVIWKSGPRSTEAVVVPTMSAAAVATTTAQVPGLDAGKDETDILDDPSFQGVHGLKPGFALLDGSKPPALSAEAPQRVKFGVVLISYRGAQRAPVASRSKAEALALAKSLFELAKTDFEAAVAKGDEGSTAAAGWMPVGVLEPAPNYVLFTTPPGEVGEPVDTPTGYWILKNISKPKK